jgi:hypothetical protein
MNKARAMRLPTAFVSIVLLLCAYRVSGEPFDRPVTTIHVDDQGLYVAGFMHWSSIQTLFRHPAEFVVVGEVVSISPSPHPSDLANGIMTSRLRIDEVVVCPYNLLEAASRIRYLETTGSGGLAIGDTVAVFMIRYEGTYAIPNWGGSNVPIGYKFRHAKNDPPCDNHSFVRLLASGHAWDLGSLSSEELRLWKCVDSEGLLEAVFDAKAAQE